MTPAELKVLSDIDETGVHVVHVEGEDGKPGFSYTVGLWYSFEQPEVIVFGLPEQVAAELFDAIADEASEDKKFRDGERHEGLLVSYPVRFVAVPKVDHTLFLGQAQWAYEGDDFPCVQLVWPDKQGRWPWEPGVRQGFAESQPVLGRKSS